MHIHSHHPEGPHHDPLHHAHQHPLHHTQARDKALRSVHITGQSCYIDMGKFYGTGVWGDMNWQTTPPTIDESKITSKQGLIGKLLGQLTQDHVKSINMSFGQMANIEKLLRDSGHPQSPTPTNDYVDSGTDTMGQMYYTGTAGTPNYGPYLTGPSGMDFVQLLSQEAHKQGIKIDLSMGGALASPDGWKIPGNPAQAAGDLATYMQNSGIDSVDFDAEQSPSSPLFTRNTEPELNTFFSTLHDTLSKQGKESLLTVEGGALTDPKMNKLMTNFNTKFDGVNLMLYSNSQYYLDANNTAWGIEQWIGKTQDPSKIHLGFYNAINYQNPSSSATQPSPYNITPGASSGTAAAEIYQQLCAKLEQDGALKSGQSLGMPFVWTDDPGSDNSNQFMRDFFNQLEGKSANFWS